MRCGRQSTGVPVCGTSDATVSKLRNPGGLDSVEHHLSLSEDPMEKAVVIIW